MGRMGKTNWGQRPTRVHSQEVVASPPHEPQDRYCYYACPQCQDQASNVESSLISEAWDLVRYAPIRLFYAFIKTCSMCRSPVTGEPMGILRSRWPPVTLDAYGEIRVGRLIDTEPQKPGPPKIRVWGEL